MPPRSSLLTVFFTRPISATILTVALAALLVPVLVRRWQRQRLPG